MKLHTIAGGFLSLSCDARGRIVSLKNRLTGTELVTHPDAAEAWRMVLATGRHTVEFLLGSQQEPEKIETVRDGGCYWSVPDGRKFWKSVGCKENPRVVCAAKDI